MNSTRLVSRTIDEFYTRASEEGRLKDGLGPLEFERNKELIGRFLPEKGGTILDVGGGPGIYSEWMTKIGYSVFLVDPVLKHIQQAQKRAEKRKKRFSVKQGEARNLDFPDNFADLVILHGPLYHLQDKINRVKAINEAKRVVKENGIILGFAINHSTSTLLGLLHGMIHNPDYYTMCKAELTTGNHVPPLNIPGMLPEAYFHRPDELKQEFTDQGLQCINLCAVEGMVWLDSSYFTSRADHDKYSTLLDVIRITESDMNLLALSPHMMIAAKKSAAIDSRLQHSSR